MTTESLKQALRFCKDIHGARQLLQKLDYPVLDTIVEQDLSELPDRARQVVSRGHLLCKVEDESGAFRVYYLHANEATRARLRTFFEPFYRRYPQGNYLFIVQPAQGEQLLFISPRHQLGQADAAVKLVLRTLAVHPDDPFRTDLDILQSIALTQPASAEEIWQKHEQAFNVERVTQRFFEEYRRLFENAESRITGVTGDAKRLFTQKLFNRLMFIRFLERKGWLRFNGRRDYLRALWEAHQQSGGTSFYRERLKPLFFAGLNTPQQVNVIGINRGGWLKELIGEVPYLNGGLFAQGEDDRNDVIDVPDEVIEPVLHDLLYRFNFTITESSPLDVEVAVDPEMLGKVFEELVTGRHETGSYYTPRPVVAFMCREALKGYLQSAIGEDADATARFVDQRDASALKDPEKTLDALRKVRVCDPACGSGAYLLGMLHELLELRTALFEQKLLDAETLYQRKLEIIQRNLYGVDIDPFAVEIARLRLWLSLVVDDERNPLDQPDVDVSLPNLDFKIEVGDSLLAPNPQGGPQPDLFREQQIADYEKAKAEYLRAHSDEEKRMLRAEIDQLREEIRQWAHSDGVIEGFDWRVEFAEVFKDGGFDIVVMNPPYISANRIPGLLRDEFRRYMEAIKERYGFTSDLYIHFIIRSVQTLRRGGHLYAITSDTYLTNVTKRWIRWFLLQLNLKTLVLMHPDVFRAEVYSCILGLQAQPPEPDSPVTYCYARQTPMEYLREALSNSAITYRVPRSTYLKAYEYMIFLPKPSSIRLFCEVLPSDDVIRIGNREYAPLEIVAPALDTGIHSGNVRHKLFFKDAPTNRQLPKLIQGIQVVRYWTVWDHPEARYRYVDVDYVPDSQQKGIGRGGKPSGRGEYWHFCGPISNHHVEERLLMRQTEDEPFVGYIYQGQERIYTDNTLHTLLLTERGKDMGFTYLYLLAVLNSAAVRAIYHAIAQEEGRTLAQVKTTIVNRLPIVVPSTEEKSNLEGLVQQIQDIYKRHSFPLPDSASIVIDSLQEQIDATVSEMYKPLLG